jgi:hypothetical protein
MAKIVCIKYIGLHYGYIESIPCVVHIFQIGVGQIHGLAYHYPLLSTELYGSSELVVAITGLSPV